MSDDERRERKAEAAYLAGYLLGMSDEKAKLPAEWCAQLKRAATILASVGDVKLSEEMLK